MDNALIYFAPLVGLLALQTGYLLCIGPLRPRFAAYGSLSESGGQVGRGRKLAFIAGVMTLALALVSPLDALADSYLLSAHMVQHILLTIVAPPLLLIGAPGWLLRPVLTLPRARPAAAFLTNAKITFAIGNVTFMAWHIPALYNAALQYRPLHIAEHLMFIMASLLLWWPILSKLPEFPPLAAPLQMLYVFLQVLPGGILGVILAMAETPLYPTYVTAPRLFGMSVLEDQQIAGLIMWIGANFFWLCILTGVYFSWVAREQAEEKAREEQPQIA